MTVSDASRKWKSKLLSSSLPLEFDIAKVCASSGFSVHASFPYHRSDAGVDKEFSVDIRAIRHTEPIEEVGNSCAFEVLIECKDRQGELVWLFLPDPNARDSFIDPTVVQGVSAFSRWFIHDTSWEIDDAPICYKGVEVDCASGNVHDEQIRHGITQLQYAVPALLLSRLSVPITSHGIRENTPFFFGVILVTTAPLLVAEKAMSRERVMSASSIRELGLEVPFLLLAYERGPDYYQHVVRQFTGLDRIVVRKGIKTAEDHRRAAGVHDWDLPSSLASRILADGRELESIADQRTVIVCNASAVPDVLERMKSIVAKSAASLKAAPRKWHDWISAL